MAVLKRHQDAAVAPALATGTAVAAGTEGGEGIRSAFGTALRGPGALAVAGAVVNGGSLVMNLVLARLLDTEAYGALTIQVGIFLILSMFGSALQMAVVHRDTATEHGESRRERWTWVRRLRGISALGVVVAGAGGLAVCGPVARLISYPHPIAIAEAILAAAIWVSLSIERGLLQARGAYESLARNLAFESCVRIAAVVGLVGAGLGVNGAGLGLVLGQLIGTEHARWASGRTPHRLVDATSAKLKSKFADFRYDPDRLTAITGPIPVVSVVRTRPGLRANTLTALGALVPLALLQNMDVVVVGALNPSGAGPYAAISTACKVPVFTGLAVANFLLPEAVRRLREGEPARGPLAMALVFVVTPGLALTAVGYVAGERLLSLVFPPELTAGAPVLWVLSLAMTYLAVTLMFTTYLLGAGDRRVVAVLSAGTAVTVLGLVVAGGGLPRTTAAALACQALNASLVGAVVVLLHRRVAGTDGTGTGTGGTAAGNTAAGGSGRSGGSGRTGEVGSGRVGESRYDPPDLPAARHRPPDSRSGRRPRDDDARTAV